jgi:alcohol dehydrogenase (cytochrome c)
LRTINRRSVRQLGLAWVLRPATTTEGAVAGGIPLAQGTAARNGFPSQLKATPLVRDGVAYMVVGAQVQALDARTGRVLWRYHWNSPGGAQLGRGVALHADSVIVQTGSDNYVVSLDAGTGTERWRRQVTDSKLGYGGTTAPVMAGAHLILGMGGDGNNLGSWLESRDPATGELQWRWNATPRPGDPAVATWPDAATAAKGGGMPWQQVTYDPELDLIYVPTGNPVPVFAGQVRPGENLYTNCIVALHAGDGSLAWYFQATPHDTHDYDATQVPVLFDVVVAGKPRKLLAQANRNGYFFLLDRVTGESLLTQPFIASANWAQGIAPDGRPIPDPRKEPQPGGVLVSPMSDGAANYPAPSYDPQTRLLYVQATTSYSLVYLDPSEEHPAGWSGGSEYHAGFASSGVLALEPVSGRIAWRHAWPDMGFVNSSYPGMLSTGGGLVFTGDPAGNFIAFDAASGKLLWHARIGKVRNAPVTYELDHRQYVLVATDDTLFAFALNE